MMENDSLSLRMIAFTSFNPRKNYPKTSRAFSRLAKERSMERVVSSSYLKNLTDGYICPGRPLTFYFTILPSFLVLQRLLEARIQASLKRYGIIGNVKIEKFIICIKILMHEIMLYPRSHELSLNPKNLKK